MLTQETELACGIFDSTVLRKHQVQTHPRHVTQYELEIFHTDTGKSYINGECYTVRRGMLLCAKPGAVRKSDLPVRCSYIRIAADAAAREGIDGLLSAMPSCAYIENAEQIDEVVAYFSKLARRLLEAPSDTLSQLRANAIFFDILYRMHRLSLGSANRPLDKPISDMLHTAREYMNEHCCENCTLQEIAETVNLSPNYLHAIFRQTFGETPHDYVTQRRIQKAKQLIMAGQLSMLDIAGQTGFCSQSHFNRVFKACTGITPRQFRNGFLEEY